MIRAALLAGGYLLFEVHAPSGQTIFVNPREITSIREPMRENRHYLAKDARCVIFMVSGNFISTREPCDEVRRLLESAGRSSP